MKKLLLMLFALSLGVNGYAQGDPITASSFGFATFNKGNAFTAVASYSTNKRVWAGTNKNKNNLNASQDDLPNTFSVFNVSDHNPGLSVINITDMVSDSSGNFWIAHQGINNIGTRGGMNKTGYDLIIN